MCVCVRHIGDCRRRRTPGVERSQAGSRHHQRVTVGSSTALSSDSQPDFGREEHHDYFPDAYRLSRSFCQIAALSRRLAGDRRGACACWRARENDWSTACRIAFENKLCRPAWCRTVEINNYAQNIGCVVLPSFRGRSRDALGAFQSNCTPP